MGQVLQCPKCRARHPLDRHASETVFACSRCSQPLKVPEQLRGLAAQATPPDADPDATAALTPSRRAGPTTVFPAAPKAAPPPPPAARTKPRPIWRLAAWAVAVLAGGLIVFVAGRAVGYLSGQRALDVVISSGIRRYTVLLPLVPVWAVITTLLVTLLLDGGQAVARRRRARTGGPQPEAPEADVPMADPEARPIATAVVADEPPPPRRTNEGRSAGGHPR